MPGLRGPAHHGYFADPFVLRVSDGSYAAYGTGGAPGGRPFEVLRSDDLERWTSHGGALEPLGDPWRTDYWAPEVAEAHGAFWMYYSAGHGSEGHTLRVARADAPEGPFRDCGADLTPDERFAIDPSPFRDDDGRWWLFYAHDVLEGERVGTTVAVAPLDPSMTALAGPGQTLLRATADWQVFLREREMYGRVFDRWHTLEGPFALRRQGRLWMLYSGGNWEQETYGVAAAVADAPEGPWEEPRPGPTVLRTEPGRLLGPGHCCVVVGPDGSDRLVYHAWNAERTAREMHIDRLVWEPGGPRVVDR
ncbi:MAG TPA: glycoside hydrolase family 43 protein [Capillimicrobium sp.]